MKWWDVADDDKVREALWVRYLCDSSKWVLKNLSFDLGIYSQIWPPNSSHKSVGGGHLLTLLVWGGRTGNRWSSQDYRRSLLDHGTSQTYIQCHNQTGHLIICDLRWWNKADFFYTSKQYRYISTSTWAGLQCTMQSTVGYPFIKL